MVDALEAARRRRLQDDDAQLHSNAMDENSPSNLVFLSTKNGENNVEAFDESNNNNNNNNDANSKNHNDARVSRGHAAPLPGSCLPSSSSSRPFRESKEGRSLLDSPESSPISAGDFTPGSASPRSPMSLTYHYPRGHHDDHDDDDDDVDDDDDDVDEGVGEDASSSPHGTRSRSLHQTLSPVSAQLLSRFVSYFCVFLRLHVIL